MGARLAIAAVAVSATAAPAATATVPPAGKVQFNRDVRPILSENCFLCHGPDKGHRKGKFRLDLREDAVNKKAIVPGKPAESSLIQRLVTQDPDDLMPPPETHKKVTAAQVAILERWISEGAEYQAHWAYLVPTRPLLPSVGDARWGHQPVDAFVLQPLEKHGVKPSPEADRRTLLRRVSLDLTGLPPDPAEVEAFVRDRRPDAYERQVDRLLASPRYGERMAVGWLDLVRFADTVGYHGDQNVNVFPYRDYVIASFNRNKPFDRFTLEQIAGDLIPDATTETRIASGFNRLNMVTREGGAQPKEYLAKYAGDRVRTVGTTWLGSTLACAECHDHKFDPFTMRDFYSLSAFFADLRQWGVYQDYGYTPNPDLRGWSNDHPFPPEIEVESDYLKQRAARFEREMDTALEAMARDLPEHGAGALAWAAEVRPVATAHPGGWISPAPRLVSGPTNATVAATGELVLTGPRANGEVLLELPVDGAWVGAVRVLLLPEGTNAIVRGGGRAQVSAGFAVAHGTNVPRKLGVIHAEATHHDPRYANGHEILGIQDTWRTSATHDHEPQAGVWVLESPGRLAPGDRLQVRLRSDALARVRVAYTPFPAAHPLESGLDPALQAALGQKPARWKGAGGHRAAESFLLTASQDAAALKHYRELWREWVECRGGRTPTVVSESWKPPVTRVLARGNWQDESGQVVTPSPPLFLAPNAASGGGRLSRVDLARWLTAAENPLTARTVMNRLWKQFFGSGLSVVVDDLGAQGEWPTHPELLDWLAVEFRESGWDLKHMVRILVLSSAYRQSSNLRPDTKEWDPGNRYLASQNPRRLEAEFVRDNALAVSGLLNLDMGGPSVRPYQPEGYYAPLQFPDRDYVAQHDERQYRRGVYMHWQRTFLHPMLANFDASSREECVAARTVSNTPQQALTLLNDPTFVEAARVLAASLLERPASDARRLESAYQRTLARAPSPSEQRSMLEFLSGQLAYYQSHADDAGKLVRVGFAPAPSKADPARLAAWTSACRVLLNLHETITRY